MILILTPLQGINQNLDHHRHHCDEIEDRLHSSVSAKLNIKDVKKNSWLCPKLPNPTLRWVPYDNAT